jgi:exonuclease III
LDPSKYLIWNVRGLNNRCRRDNVKTLVLNVKPAVIYFQETKLSSINAFDMLSILGTGYSNYVYSPAQGTRGGILVTWRDGVYSCINDVVRGFSVSLLLEEDSGCSFGSLVCTTLTKTI